MNIFEPDINCNVDVIDSSQKPKPNRDTRGARPEEFLELYGNDLYRYAYYITQNPEVAEELVQETLLKAVTAHEGFRGEASVKTWLIQILRNEISAHFRRKDREREFHGGAGESIDMSSLLNPKISNAGFQTTVERQEFWSMIESCFANIPRHLLQAFLLKHTFPDQTSAELCDQLGINASNFSVRMFRARLMLRKCIETNWS